MSDDVSRLRTEWVEEEWTRHKHRFEKQRLEKFLEEALIEFVVGGHRPTRGLA